MQSIQSCSYNNIVANGNHKVDKVSFENLNSPHEKSKMIFNKSNQVDGDDSQNNNDNQTKISETKDEQSMTLDKRIDKNNPATGNDKIPEKETKEQIIESYYSDKKSDVTPIKKTKKKTVVIVGNSIVPNVPSHSLNQSLKEFFSVVKSFPSVKIQDMKDYIKLNIATKPNMVILHTGANDLQSNQNPSDIANEIISLAKNIKISGTEVSISSLIPRGDRLSEKGKKVNKELQEKYTAENFASVLHKNINNKLDLFRYKLHLSKKGQGILKENFRKIINDLMFFTKGIMLLFKITIFC